MLDFNNIINEIFKTPPSLYLLPFLQLLLLLLPPPAPSVLAVLVLVLLGCLFYPLYCLPITSFKDIWDVPSLNKKVEEEIKVEEKVKVENKEDKEDKNSNIPTRRLRYII
jgi:hypothetical protein